MSASHSAARFACSLAVVLAALLALQPMHAAAADAPGAVELEFWRSSDRLGNASAYQAYLDAYPRGTFAPLARAGLEKMTPSAAPTAAVPVARLQLGTTLRTFSEEAPNTNSISFKLGDKFAGPGPITVGWAGGKKQILLLSGVWIALAAADHLSDQAGQFDRGGHVPVRANMTSLVFGKFEGSRVVTLMRSTVSNQRTVVTRWSDVEGCDDNTSASTQLIRRRTATRFGDICASVRGTEDGTAVLGRLAEETNRNLARLGATLPTGPAIASVISIDETTRGYLGSTRIDFPGGTLADWAPFAVAQSPARAALVGELADWQKRYQAVANEGLTRNIDIAELTAGGATAAAPAATAVVDDFDVSTSSPR